MASTLAHEDVTGNSAYLRPQQLAASDQQLRARAHQKVGAGARSGAIVEKPAIICLHTM